MPNTGKMSKDRGKIPTQSKLTDFGVQSMEQKVSQEASMEESGGGLTDAKEEILTAINNLKSEFSTRFDGILTAIEETEISV